MRESECFDLKRPCQGSMDVADFFDFNVYSREDNHTFVHIDCSNETTFYDSFAKFFFSEERILRYIENDKSLSFKPQLRNYVSLYKNLLLFVDKPRECELDIASSQDVLDVLLNEYEVSVGSKTLKVRDSTVGRFGELFLHTLLSEYFGFDCIIPKVRLTTNRNMSIFGIDSLFYSSENKVVYFGEAKVSNNLESGIKLLKKSLSNYEHQIREEFLLVLSNRNLVGDSSFYRVFGDDIETTMNVMEFIRKAEISTIGVPLFVAHGGRLKPSEILEQFEELDFPDLLDVKTMYIGLSLPIINKESMIDAITSHIKAKLAELQDMGQL